MATKSSSAVPSSGTAAARPESIPAELIELEASFADSLADGLHGFNVAASVAALMIQAGADRRATLLAIIDICDIVTAEADKLRALLVADGSAAP